MFPWAHRSNNFGDEYKLEKKDYFLLLQNKQFIKNYIFGLNAIIEAKKNGVNAMTSMYVNGQRVIKIIVSSTSFRNAAKLSNSQYYNQLNQCLITMYDLWPELNGKKKKFIDQSMKKCGIYSL